MLIVTSYWELIFCVFFSRAKLAILLVPEGKLNVVVILCAVGPWNLVCCQMKRINLIKLFKGLHATFQFLYIKELNLPQ